MGRVCRRGDRERWRRMRRKEVGGKGDGLRRGDDIKKREREEGRERGGESGIGEGA